MRTFVIQFHPLSDSYNVSLLHAVVDALEETGTPNEVVRLAQGDEVDRERLATSGHLILVTPHVVGRNAGQGPGLDPVRARAVDRR